MNLSRSLHFPLLATAWASSSSCYLGAAAGLTDYLSDSVLWVLPPWLSESGGSFPDFLKCAGSFPVSLSMRNLLLASSRFFWFML